MKIDTFKVYIQEALIAAINPPGIDLDLKDVVKMQAARMQEMLIVIEHQKRSLEFYNDRRIPSKATVQ